MSIEKSLIKNLIPTIVLVIILLIVGLFLRFFTDSVVFWPGYYSMIFFYGIIFFMGTYARNLKKEDSVNDVMLAGRNIPLWIAVFTMSATWVGGGYINGTAEYTFDSSYGLMWVQAPWGYGLSLIVGGALLCSQNAKIRI